MHPFPIEFYARPTAEVARDLLGAVLVHRTRSGLISGQIVETEAYCGSEDPGSHAFRGSTPRNEVMFGAPGRAYVYRSYGIHACLNAVTESEGNPGAVLIRALQPLSGLHLMERNRGRCDDLCNGPGKLCQALGIGLELNGADLTGTELYIELGEAPAAVGVSGRIGLSRGADLQLRFFLPGSPFVSRGKPHVTQ